MRAIQSANASGSRSRICAAVSPSQRPMSISRSAGTTVGIRPCGAPMISALRRERPRSLENTAVSPVARSRAACTAHWRSPSADSGTSRWPMKRRVLAPSTSPCRSR